MEAVRAARNARNGKRANLRFFADFYNPCVSTLQMMERDKDLFKFVDGRDIERVRSDTVCAG